MRRYLTLMLSELAMLSDRNNNADNVSRAKHIENINLLKNMNLVLPSLQLLVHNEQWKHQAMFQSCSKLAIKTPEQRK